jgi:hypothetical protein
MCSINVTDQVSHPHKTTSKIIILYRMFQNGWVKCIPHVQGDETMNKVPLNVGLQITSE